MRSSFDVAADELISVRLCAMSFEFDPGPSGSAPWRPPAEALVTDVKVDGRLVEMRGVLDLFSEQLTRQRAELPQPTVAPPAVDCTTTVPTTRLGLEPRTTSITSLHVCPRMRLGVPYQIRGDDLGVFDEAWSRAVAGGPDGGQHRDLCPGTDDNDRIIATTNFGDVFGLEFNGCGNYRVRAQGVVVGSLFVHLTAEELERLSLPSP